LGLHYIDLYLIHWPGASGLKSEDPENARLRHESYRELQRGLEEGACVCVSVLCTAEWGGGGGWPAMPCFLCVLSSVCCTWSSVQSIHAMQSGKIRCLGVSNFDERHLEALLTDPTITHLPKVNQARCALEGHSNRSIRLTISQSRPNRRDSQQNTYLKKNK
jgi:diketogulonate reductase-like aldo/keto reductase